ncbi:MAG: hypothetical protein IJZ79_02585 [Bacilli bacterium]|nr:hypothetical protein [Bacilli bacterium]MBQ8218613.1 hypothetical protein [Bacilli bacterium]
MKLTRYEQETVINYNNEESGASIYTADPVIQRKLDKLVEKYPDDYKCTKIDNLSDTQTAKFYELSSKKFISFRPPVHMTEEQKKAAAERLAAYRNSMEED